MSMHHARRRLAPLTDYEPTMDDTINELAEHPRAVRIYMHLSVLRRYGFDPCESSPEASGTASKNPWSATSTPSPPTSRTPSRLPWTSG